MNNPFALIIEDNPEAATLFRRSLELAGFETQTVAQVATVSEQLARCLPWLVILDLDMPGLPGTGLLEMIRNDIRLRPIKVIAVTSYSQVAENLTVEPDLLLFKPVSIEQFSDFIARLQLKLKYQTTIPIMGEPWDRVTGLYNQAFFMDRLENTLMQTKKNREYLFAVLGIRLDPNGVIRNELSISEWMAALRETAETLQFASRPTDIIARFDQDNFFILLENIPSKEVALVVADRMHKKLEHKLAALGNSVQFPLNTRVLLCDGKYENTDQILREVESTRSIQDSQEKFFTHDDQAP